MYIYIYIYIYIYLYRRFHLAHAPGPEVKLGPQKRACAVTFVYVVAVETVYSIYLL